MCVLRAKKDLDGHVMVTCEWKELCSGLDQKMIIMAPFCGLIPCEDLVKKNSARSVCSHTLVLHGGKCNSQRVWMWP